MAGGVVLSLVAGLLAPVSVAAAPVRPGGGGVSDRSVPVSPVPARPVSTPAMPDHVAKPVVWPSAGVSMVDLPAAGSAVASVGGLPVRVSSVESGDLPMSGRVSARSGPARVRVEVLDRAVSARAGAPLAVRVSRADGVAASGPVRLEVDYSGFRDAFGADWGWRLRLWELPGCALAGPVDPRREGRAGPVDGEDCVGYRDLGAVNDGNRGVISAELAAPAAGSEPLAVGVMAAGSSSETGDFTRTDLTESSSWAAGMQSGDFSWSYPIGVPPVPGGLVPKVGLSYSSGAVDGQTAGRHTQPSVVGEGWSLSQSFVERTYRPCSDDTANGPYWTALNFTADLCWRLPNAQVMLNGRTSEIVPGDDGVWRLEDGNGEKVELLTGAPNNDNDGEHWKITTTDGTQYWFGRYAMPNGKGSTWSVAAVPVYANHAGEPCFSTASVTASKCMQAWRWMLDYVVDRNGNEMSLWYGGTSNRTALVGNPSSTMAYQRDIHLNRIEYGTHTSDASTVQAPARVSFGYVDRCLTTTCGTRDAANWPDTPWDLQCDVAPCANNLTPSFWTDRRMSFVYAQVLIAGVYKTVDAHFLTHTFPSTGDSSHPALWLAKIQHAGWEGGPLYKPAVTFFGVRYQNRADYNPTATMRSHNKWRISRVVTESGHQVDVTYASTDSGCQFDGTFPNPDNNSKRCFPQYYVSETAGAGWSWWHKRVVSKVVESDATGSSTEPVTHEYSYSTAATSTTVLWAHDAAARVWGSSLEFRSWADWRGYSNVTVMTGPPGGLRSQTEYVYFRGLHGDRIDTGTRSVQLTPYSGSYDDQPQRRGHLVNTVVYDQAGGVPQQIMQYDPWTQVTGTRTLSSDWAIPSTFTSRINRTFVTRRWERREETGTVSFRTRLTDTFDPATGRITSREDTGNSGSGDETCTRYSYADNPGRHMYAFLIREQKVGLGCADPYTIPDDLLSDHAIRYDGGGYGTAPTLGNVTRDYVHSGTGWVDLARDHVYDKYGRVTYVEDGLGRATTTAYTNNADRLTSSVLVTNPAGHQVKTSLDVLRGLPTSVTDANGKISTGTYDPLGRLLTITRPGNTTGLPDVEYTYYMSAAYRSYVRTRTLGPNGTQVTAYEMFDGLLRPRQTQSTAPDGKRVIADTRYDQRGLPVKNTVFYNAASGPTSTLVTFNDADVDQQTRVTYDGRGRPTVTGLWSHNVFKWQTTMVYAWDRTGVIPPTGGTTTQDVYDDRGNLAEQRQFTTSSLTGPYDATRYGYNLRNELTSVTDPANNVWTYEYDLLGRQTKAIDPDAGTTARGYDAAGQLTASTDGRGVTLAYFYDNLGRTLSVHDGTTGGPKLAKWTYDTVAKGQLSESTRNHGGLAYTTAILGYDDGYRPTSTRLTVPASTGNGALAGSYTFGTTYKMDGSVATTTLPAAGDLPAETLTHTYLNAGPVDTLTTSWTHGGSQTYINDTQYSFDGQVSQQTLGTPGRKARITYTHDPTTRRLLGQQVDTEDLAAPGTFVDRYTTEYSYDHAGNIGGIAGKTAGVRDQVECPRYDYLRRLTEAWTAATWNCSAGPQRAGADPYWRQWTFDKTGNRLTQVDKDPVAGDTTWTYQVGAAGGVKPHQVKKVDATGPAAGTATRSFGYDAAGNTTSRTTDTGTAQTLTWDKEGHLGTLTEGGSATSYVYDADGRRLISRAPSRTTLYLPDGSELDLPAGGSVTGTRHYGGIAVRNSAGLKWVIADHHGTGTIQIDATTLTAVRRRAMPYGEPRGPQPTWVGTKGFVGGTTDDTGLSHLGAREYDPSLGRFVSVDPLIDHTDPQQMHGYAYANNGVPTSTDPDGLRNCSDPVDCAGDPTHGNPGHGNGSTPQSSKTGYHQERPTTKTPTPPGPPASPTTDDSPLANAKEAAEEAKQQVIQAATILAKVAMDVLGITAALNCFLTGDLGACAETAINIALAFVGGMIAKLAQVAVKYLFRAKALKALIDTVRGAGSRLVSGLRNWLKNSRLAKQCGNSFMPGTLVVLADGSTKPIEVVQPGDLVLATDPETDLTEAKTVLATITGRGTKHLVKITVAAGDEARTGGTLIATDNHPFWIPELREWVDATNLQPGQWLRTSSGTWVQITAVARWTQPATVHNLTIATIHTYYVLAGDTPVLVHNTGPACEVPGHSGIHQFPGTTAGKSQFSDGMDLNGLSNTNGATGVLQKNGNTRYVMRGNGEVGVDRTTGLPTDIYTVIRKPDGSVLTMFPGTSPMS